MGYRVLVPLLLLGVSVGCGDASRHGSIGHIEYLDGPCRPAPARPDGGSDAGRSPPSPAQSPSPPARFAVAFTAGGQLVVIEPELAGRLAEVVASPSAAVRDVDWDAGQKRLVLFESDEDQQGGEVAAYAVDLGDETAALGPREHLAWVDGVARIMASTLGVVVFEESIGARWRLLWNDRLPRPSVAAPRPASAWIQKKASGSFLLHALTYGTGTLERRTTAVAPDGIAPESAPSLDVAPGTDPATARMVVAPALDADVLADVVEGRPALRLSHDAEVTEAVALEEAGTLARIEAAIALDGGRTVVLLTSEPTRLLAARIDAQGNVTGEDALDLPGAARREEQFFSRDLAVVGPDRLLVATDAGVMAARVVTAGASVAIDVDAAFAGLDLRGPLVGIP